MAIIEEIFKGDCIDPGSVSVLKKGTNYFLFPAGPFYFYASKFPSKSSHRGCFEKRLFGNLEKYTPEPDVKATIMEAAPEEEEFEQLLLF